MSRSPLYVRVLMALSWRFSQRRQVVNLWCWMCSANWLNSTIYRMKHPIFMADVDRRVRILRQGKGYLDA